jgi:hypothetical protein
MVIIKRVMAGSVTVSGWPSWICFDKERDNRAAAGHNIAIAGNRNNRITASHPGLSYCNLLHHSFGDAHSVDRIDGFIRAENDNPLDSIVSNSRVQNVFCTQSVGS